MACSPGSLELLKSDLDMASKLFTFTNGSVLQDWNEPVEPLRKEQKDG